jgi:transcriptional regulator with XRE-family HTH domain
MSDRQDVTEEILDYLLGDGERPAFEDVDEAARDAATAQLEALGGALDDDGMVPSFHDDPVAVRLGFRSGSNEARIYGTAVAVARRAAGLTERELAIKVSASGNTIDTNQAREIEQNGWRTVTADFAEALASALGVDPRQLGDPLHQDELLNRVGRAIIETHDDLVVTRFEEPFAGGFTNRFLVAFLDLRILLIVCNSDVDREAVIEFASRSIADADRYAMIAAVDNDSDLTTWPIRISDVLERYAAPDGAHTIPIERPLVTPTSLQLAIEGLVEGGIIRWGSFGVDLRRQLDGDIAELRERAGAEALKRIRSSASRVAKDRKEAFGSVDATELANAQRLIDRLLAGGVAFDPDGALDELVRVS